MNFSNKGYLKRLNIELPNTVHLTNILPNAPFLYHLKTSENRKVFWCFQGVEKGCIGNEWVNRKLYYLCCIWTGKFLAIPSINEHCTKNEVFH